MPTNSTNDVDMNVFFDETVRKFFKDYFDKIRATATIDDLPSR
jgi:hypothetical protein